jgi:hypothetical protein
MSSNKREPMRKIQRFNSLTYVHMLLQCAAKHDVGDFDPRVRRHLVAGAKAVDKALDIMAEELANVAVPSRKDVDNEA